MSWWKGTSIRSIRLLARLLLRQNFKLKLENYLRENQVIVLQFLGIMELQFSEIGKSRQGDGNFCESIIVQFPVETIKS